MGRHETESKGAFGKKELKRCTSSKSNVMRRPYKGKNGRTEKKEELGGKKAEGQKKKKRSHQETDDPRAGWP